MKSGVGDLEGVEVRGCGCIYQRKNSLLSDICCDACHCLAVVSVALRGPRTLRFWLVRVQFVRAFKKSSVNLLHSP